MTTLTDCHALPQFLSSAKHIACCRLMGEPEPQPEPFNFQDRQQRASIFWIVYSEEVLKRQARFARYRFIFQRAAEKLRQILTARKRWAELGRLLSHAKREREARQLPETAPLEWFRCTSKAKTWFHKLGTSLNKFAGRDRVYAVPRRMTAWPDARSNVMLPMRGKPVRNNSIVHLRPWDSDRYYTGGGMRYLMPRDIYEQRLGHTVLFSWNHPRATVRMLANARVGAHNAERRGHQRNSKWWRNLVVVVEVQSFPVLTADAYQDSADHLFPVTGASRLD